MSNDFPVAIVDYGLGNLFSVRQACQSAGLPAVITNDPRQVEAAPAAIVPGVGAFGDAMSTLRRLGLDTALRDAAQAGKPLVGVCLGMQLFMTESFEFGRHRGLGFIEGQVVRLGDEPVGGLVGLNGSAKLKVPQVGWTRIHRPATAGGGDPWAGTLLQGQAEGEYMYFVHSYYCRPASASVTLATAAYGDTVFCASLRQGNIFACQFHPERSGPAGLKIYENLAALTRRRREGASLA